ncbi:fatty acid desaturase [Devosia sp.]|uniref:fatty acid desaturase n=1 Tax=Devosia sp. TaxID=1871048 RepID=UPI001B016629|nr:fatty acid desaturase [Devosia sp.]MBO9589733.1 fatty acid desaturase [Devosia sp.]
MMHRADQTIPYVRARTLEWPTLALVLAIYGGWLAFTFFWQSIPLWLLVPLAAWIVAWQGSLQHEIIHGHPTRIRALNDALGWPPLSLWLPYPIYKLSHLQHHRDERLTDPLDDPESFYITEKAWSDAPAWLRALLRFNQTLLGRLIVGPAFMIGFFLHAEFGLILANHGTRRRMWTIQAVLVALVLVWVLAICQMPLWLYLLAFVYAGGALTRIRSFAEHRYADKHEERTAIVEGGGPLALLFLNNNLHVLHHLRPTIAWYDLPAFYRAHRETLVERNGGLVYRSYGELFGRFFVRPHDKLLHPHHCTTDARE